MRVNIEPEFRRACQRIRRYQRPRVVFASVDAITVRSQCVDARQAVQ